MKRRAVLFDVGGPIETEVAWEALMDGIIRREVRQAIGREVTDAAYDAAWRGAVESHAPHAYQAVVWELMEGDAGRAPLVWSRIAEAARLGRGAPEIRPGIAELLVALQAQGVRLALAANLRRLRFTPVARSNRASMLADSHSIVNITTTALSPPSTRLRSDTGLPPMVQRSASISTSTTGNKPVIHSTVTPQTTQLKLRSSARTSADPGNARCKTLTETRMTARLASTGTAS